MDVQNIKPLLEHRYEGKFCRPAQLQQEHQDIGEAAMSGVDRRAKLNPIGFADAELKAPELYVRGRVE